MKIFHVICQFGLLLVISTYCATRYKLPKSLLMYEQTDDQLLCWLYCSHTIMDYYGKVGGLPVPSLEETWQYGNSKVNNSLKLWGKPQIPTGHTYQDVLCELGGIYSTFYQDEIPQATLEKEINGKRPVVMVIDFNGSDISHLVTVYAAGTSPLSQWLEYVDPLLLTGKAIKTREQLATIEGKSWGKTVLFKNSPGTSCDCDKYPDKLTRDVQGAIGDSKYSAGAEGQDCATTWCPSGTIKVKDVDGNCDCEIRDYICDNKDEPMFIVNGADIKVNLYEIGTYIVNNHESIGFGSQNSASDACDRTLLKKWGIFLLDLVLKIDWGDGSSTGRYTSLKDSPKHTYAASGSYTVTVKVAKRYWDKSDYWTGCSFTVNIITSDDSRKAAIASSWNTLNPWDNKLVNLPGGERIYVGTKEVTQYDYVSVMKRVPFYFWDEGGFDLPAENMSFYDAIIYCNRRSLVEGYSPVYNWDGTPQFDVNGTCTSLGNITPDFNKNGYRLPTPDEWEYSYRAGTTTPNYWGNNNPNNYCWNQSNSNVITHSVGQLLPNNYGLFDMSGNVMEMTFGNNPDSVGITGGCFDSDILTYNSNLLFGSIKSFFTFQEFCTIKSKNIGFRVVRKAPADLIPILNLLLD